jgi:hypothetical protein
LIDDLSIINSGVPPFDLEKSLRNARLRLPEQRRRRPRSDAGSSRLPPAVAVELTRLLHEQERPRIQDVLRRLAAFCGRRRLRRPARATIYRFMDTCAPHSYAIAELPAWVGDALYNLDPTGHVPGPQLAFYAFHHGETRAMCFAAGLPWLDLHQADRMRGWRPRSHGLLRAVLRRRRVRGGR